MIKYFLFLCFSIAIILPSCNSRNSEVLALSSDTDLVQLLNNKEEKLLLITQSECKPCIDISTYFGKKLNPAISKNLSKSTKIYTIAIDDFKDKNIWLFHVLQNYSYPLIILTDAQNNIQGMHKGSNLSSLKSFFTSYKNKETISSPSSELNNSNTVKYSVLLKSYLKLKQDGRFTEDEAKQIYAINKQGPNFISSLLEAYIYQQKQNYPDRVRYIKDRLLENELDSNSFYYIQKPLVLAL